MSENQLVKLVNEKQATLWDIKASYLNEGQEIYFKRALLNIMQNDDLVAISKTHNGALSIFHCIGKALQMGLQIGGQIPQAYLLPFAGKVELSPTWEGYKFIALSDPPVMKSFYIQAIYDGDNVSINAITGEVSHNIEVTDKRRKLVGVYCQIEELDGKTRADFMSRGDIEEIRDKWSMQPQGKAWVKSFDQMAMAKAAKRFLKPYAADKEGLKMAMAVSENEQTEPDNRPINKRADDILDIAILEPETEMTAEAEKTEEPEAEPENKKEGDLF